MIDTTIKGEKQTTDTQGTQESKFRQGMLRPGREDKTLSRNQRKEKTRREKQRKNAMSKEPITHQSCKLSINCPSSHVEI